MKCEVLADHCLYLGWKKIKSPKRSIFGEQETGKLMALWYVVHIDIDEKNSINTFIIGE